MPFTNAQTFVKSIQQTVVKIDSGLHSAILELGELGVKHAQETKLFHNNGPLRSATKFHLINQFHGFVLADKPYAYWLEKGNNQQGPFIYPKFAKCLHFFANGQEVFTKKVKSHGPLPFMEQARDQLQREADAIIKAHMKKAIK